MRNPIWLCIAAAWLGFAPPAPAADYPVRQINMFIPTAPGGSASISGQILAEFLKKQLAQPVVISYKPGAAQAVGTEQVLKGRADGYTLGYSFEPDLASKIVLDGKTLAFGKDDFLNIGATAFAPYLLWVKSDAPWKTFDELVQHGRSNELSFSTAGIGAMNHIYVEVIARKTGIKINHVPYAGGGPATTALLGGHVNMAVGSIGRMKQYLDSGMVRPLVVLAAQRIPEAREVPTAKEKGFAIEGYVYHRLFGPKALPSNIVSRLTAAFEKAVADPEFQSALSKTGFEPRFLNARATKEMWEADFQVVEEVLSQGGQKK
ncbi:MAG TPA: tripartite tricarboxylate transporter substrate binding protein [Thermodesulfobacteriota bacterium]|nr:tripartite tricarboxylate transporter substrate binding protein [Thermodesulfobacteriota bacterium]